MNKRKTQILKNFIKILTKLLNRQNNSKMNYNKSNSCLPFLRGNKV